MDVRLQANAQINERVCTQDQSDSYGFKADVSCCVYRAGQHQPGVTHRGAEWVRAGRSTVPIRGGLADTAILQERRKVLGFSVTQG